MPTESIPPLRYRRLWTALGWGFVALVVYLSLARPPSDVDLPDVNLGHVVAYGWLMIWFAQLYRSRRERWLYAAGFGVLGIVLEFIQGMTGYRQFEYADMVRNFAGIAIGLLLARTAAQNALYEFERLLAARRAA